MGQEDGSTGAAYLTLTIHAGLHKTGTTWLQKHVFPKMTPGSFVNGVDRPISDFFEDFAGAESPILWSQETLSGVRGSDYSQSRRDILKFVANTWPGSNLILVFREQSDWIRSLYDHHYDEGGTMLFDDWMERHGFEYALDHNALIDYVLRLPFGRRLFLDYDQLKQNPEATIKAIGEFVGCGFPGWKNVKTNQRQRATIPNDELWAIWHRWEQSWETTKQRIRANQRFVLGSPIEV